MKRFWLIIAVFWLLAGCTLNRPEMRVGNTKIRVEIADQPEIRVKGLSGRSSLAKDQGMLFEFEALGKYGFWMKDMNFPLDFIWINNNEVVGVTKNAQPDEVNIFPPQPVDKVLEVNSGWVDNNQIKVGDKISL